MADTSLPSLLIDNEGKGLPVGLEYTCYSYWHIIPVARDDVLVIHGSNISPVMETIQIKCAS